MSATDRKLPTADEPVLTDADRRTFLRQTALALLAAPAAGSALLAGCDGGGLGTDLAGVLAAIRRALQALLDDAERTNFPTRAQWDAWLAQFNQQSAQCQNAARAASAQQLRANYDPVMQPVTDWLNQQNIPPDFSEPWEPFTETELRNAWTRAQTLLAARLPADQRALWAFVLGLALLAGGASDQEVLDTADDLRADDTTDVAGRVYDAVFGVGPVAADAPANLANRTVLFNLLPLLVVLLLGGLLAHAARNLGILVAVHPQALLVLAIFLAFFFPN